MKKYIIYKHTTPSNKIYIGITSRNPIKRWNNGNGYRKNIHFFRAIVKYGWNNIKHEILYTDLTEKEAKTKEIELIAQYNSTNINFGYNITKGGDTRASMSEETRLKIISKLKGQKRTEEQKLKYKKAAMLRPKRLFLSEEHKQKISKSLIGNKRALGNTKNRIKVAQYTLDNIYIKTWDCAKLAAEFIKCDASGINTCCREQRDNYNNLENTKYKGKYKNYIWRYVNGS